MSNELIPADIAGPLAKYELADVASGASAFLQRLQLFGNKSNACARGEIGIGRWGLVNDDVITDLGPEVDALVICWRPKAMQTTGDILVSHEPGSSMYEDLKERSGVKDSGCMYGPEFLLYIPSQATFATYYMSSKTARREARKMDPLLRKAATFKAKLIETAKYTWHGPVVTPCSASLDLPETEVIQAEITKFMDPPKQEVEVAPEESRDR